jgi:GDP-mannose 6-dehydrogenase
MKISVFGMGYVGCVTAACLSKQGHKVVGVDVNHEKVRAINEGRAPLIEPNIEDMIRDSVRAGSLRATTDPTDAISATDLSLVCVGTPSMRNGRLDLSGITEVSKELGQALRGKADFHTFAIRSTILPGTIETLVMPAIRAESGKQAGKEFSICYNPEFMREGTAVADFYDPPLTVIGAENVGEASTVASVYEPLKKPIVITEVRVAEMLKYACNSFHALKIAFANEIGTLATAAGVDAHALMRVFCSDEKLNISRAYLEPGFAFGGSCLPKDIRAMLYRATELDLKLPILESILPSNQLHLGRSVDLILGTGKRRIAVLGLSFKADTDDLRESPMISLVKALLGEGCQVKIFDEKVELSRLVGTNRRFIEETIPHIGALLDSSLERVVSGAEVVVAGRDVKEFANLKKILHPSQTVIQLNHLGQFVGSAADPVGLR